MTKYLIRANQSNVFLKNHPTLQHWTVDTKQAKHFEFMTEAVIVATIHCGLGDGEYSIVMVESEKES
jgi:hypothetical protein